MTLVPKQQDKSCFKACDAQTISNGLCDCVNRINNFVTPNNTGFVSVTCEGEECCICGKPATNKIGEEIPPDDPNPNRHNLTGYVCREHFNQLFG